MLVHLFIACSYIHALCISVGFLFSSGIVLYGYFWFLYVCHLAIRMMLPIKSVKHFNSDYSRKIYIAEILGAFFIATIPSFVNAGLSNYKISTFPPTLCRSYGNLHFYGTIIPNMGILCVTMILMLLVLYKIHLVSSMIYLKFVYFIANYWSRCTYRQIII